MRFPLSLRMVPGSAAQDTRQKVLYTKAETTALSEIPDSSGIRNPFANVGHQFDWNGRSLLLQIHMPSGVLEGAIPLSLGNAAIRSALGKLFTFKSIILITVVVLSILFYRPFCKWICPLGAIYSLFNKISFLGIKIENDKCIGCQQCTKACKMDVNVLKTPNHPECIRCGACMKVCPKDAIHYQFMGKDMCIHKHKGTK